MIGKAQVHDEEKCLQWRSMETGPLEFAPKLYYYLFHNSYAHHEWGWEWRGFHSKLGLHLKENKSDAKPLIPKRTLGATTDLWTEESTDSQEKDFKHQLEQETLAAADRRVDGAYLLFKDDFDNMQDKISAGLTYCLANSKGDANVISLVNSLSNQNRFITEQVVVCCTTEDATQHNPQICRRTEPHAHNGSEDGSCSSNIQELYHKDAPSGQHNVIDTIGLANGWGLAVVWTKYTFHHPTVNHIAHYQGQQTNQKR